MQCNTGGGYIRVSLPSAINNIVYGGVDSSLRSHTVQCNTGGGYIRVSLPSAINNNVNGGVDYSLRSHTVQCNTGGYMCKARQSKGKQHNCTQNNSFFQGKKDLNSSN